MGGAITHDNSIHREYLAEVHDHEFPFLRRKIAAVEHVVAGETTLACLLPSRFAAEWFAIGQFAASIYWTKENLIGV